MKAGKRINGIGVKKGRRSLREVDQVQDQGLETGEETDQDPETGAEMIIEIGAGETETDLPEETEVLENTDLILH